MDAAIKSILPQLKHHTKTDRRDFLTGSIVAVTCELCGNLVKFSFEVNALQGTDAMDPRK